MFDFQNYAQIILYPRNLFFSFNFYQEKKQKLEKKFSKNFTILIKIGIHKLVAPKIIELAEANKSILKRMSR